jgi:hypothetical protein
MGKHEQQLGQPRPASCASMPRHLEQDGRMNSRVTALGAAPPLSGAMIVGNVSSSSTSFSCYFFSNGTAGDP